MLTRPLKISILFRVFSCSLMRGFFETFHRSRDWKKDFNISFPFTFNFSLCFWIIVFPEFDDFLVNSMLFSASLKHRARAVGCSILCTGLHLWTRSSASFLPNTPLEFLSVWYLSVVQLVCTLCAGPSRTPNKNITRKSWTCLFLWVTQIRHVDEKIKSGLNIKES